MSDLPARTKYAGARALVLAFDIGDHVSRVSYSILEPGVVPDIYPLTRFPHQVAPDKGTPTIIYYDREGKVRAVGAETQREGIFEEADEGNWFKASHLMRDLQPVGNVQHPPLKVAVHPFSDYMNYLLRCSKQYISEMLGDRLWESLEDSIVLILSHPNQWTDVELAQTKEAATTAVLATLAKKDPSRFRFVAEGKATLRACTVTMPESHSEGMASVTARAEQFFKYLMVETAYENDVEILKDMFDRRTKFCFQSDAEVQHIQFGSYRLSDSSLNIRAGRLRVAGNEIAKFFDPTIACSVRAIKAQMLSAFVPIKTVFLIGSFTKSNWLFEKVRDEIELFGVAVSRPARDTSISSGAILSYLDGKQTSFTSLQQHRSPVDNLIAGEPVGAVSRFSARPRVQVLEQPKGVATHNAAAQDCTSTPTQEKKVRKTQAEGLATKPSHSITDGQPGISHDHPVQGEDQHHGANIGIDLEPVQSSATEGREINLQATSSAQDHDTVQSTTRCVDGNADVNPPVLAGERVKNLKILSKAQGVYVDTLTLISASAGENTNVNYTSQHYHFHGPTTVIIRDGATEISEAILRNAELPTGVHLWGNAQIPSSPM